jgi:hypothetical protein
MPSLIPIGTAVTPLMPLTIPIVTAVTPLMPLTIPPMGSVSTPPPSPIVATALNIGGVVGGAIASLFSPNPSIQGLVTTPAPAQTQLFPAGTAGAAFTSNPTIPPTADELAAQALANLQVAAAANQPDPSLVINKPGVGTAGGNLLSGDLGTPLFNLTAKQKKEEEKKAKAKAKRDEKKEEKAKEKAIQAAKTKEEREAEEDEASASFGN